MLQSSQYAPLYGSQDQLPVLRRSRLQISKRWLTHYGLGVIMVMNVGILLLLGWDLHNSTANAARTIAAVNVAASPTAMTSTVVLPSLPAKFSVEYVTPYKNQAGRGTCWDFGTIGLLEQSYRRHGVVQGWLAPHDYVAFSEQAYGIEVAAMCTGRSASPQQKACRIADDNIWRNSTEGGEVPLLYYLQHGLHDAVYPDSVCPYIPTMGHDLECPGLALRRPSNPLRFTVEAMETYYEEATIKAQLVARSSAMPFSTNMVTLTHYYPCIGDLVTDPRCAPSSCHLCPPELPQATCCIPQTGDSSVTMEGEFVSHSSMASDGGHVMLLVGFNDLYETRDGFTGGFIVKNSWADSRYQGSHSMQYWMQNISEWEERILCPNSYNPFSWYIASEEDDVVGIDAVLSDDSKLYAHLNQMPLHLRCIDADACDPSLVYFAKNRTDYGDHMYIMCFYEYNMSYDTSTLMCLPPLRQAAIADVFEPVEVYANDPDLCGFYMIPYDVNRHINAQFQGFFVNSFDISWAPQSYAANADAFLQYDYGPLLRSTKRQRHVSFDGPFPNAHVFKAHRHRHAT
ncbi:hypothetical protein SDRG_10589 [Saprolegnia diclina VS20]|uniref:Peptidase C1A papain C-terminal domain-containing protein n=1 Tax=Saprolegnia diclina (strain VS20) TaxID=1156394 RepID=T0QDZ8_SAPDV|nr:hypothetical protein SDRG_10589 [Saprolegnia diclina VS20]EQC31800.1 hypothetical protein SDRG_10589 [Saprolegnia diclina VS20]|eukprot:XP_008614807.1 hypothetical protein SDRG_10589 [Saprolegnia diclina VS20]